MPELRFEVRWPDGSHEQCWSPSLVVHDHMDAGAAYPLDEFVRRAGAALTAGSERIRAAYGVPCSRSLAQLAAIERRAATQPDGVVEVLSLEPPLP